MKYVDSFLVLIVAVVVAFIVAFYAARNDKSSCEASNGKWASVSETCITRDCYKSQTCGERSYPGERCDRLKIGDSRAEVYFQLGMPLETSSTFTIWNLEKASSERIIAQFSSDTLSSISCASHIH
jgi:hypothetical protein